MLVQHVSLKPPRTHASIPPQEKPALPLPSIPSIAVLPFANLSGDPDQPVASARISALLALVLKVRTTVGAPHRRRLNQHHRVQTTRPQSVEPDPEPAVENEQSEPTRPLATRHVQLVTQSEVLQFHNRATPESAGNN